MSKEPRTLVARHALPGIAVLQGSGICPQQLLTTQTYRNIHRGVRWSSVGTNIYSS